MTVFCAGNSPGTGEFPSQRPSNAENVSIWWRHHDAYGSSWFALFAAVWCRSILPRLGSLHWLGVHLTPSEAALRTADAYIKRIWSYDDVIKWKHFSCYWPCVRGIHRSPVNSPHKVQWRGALMGFFFICAWINGWVNNRGAGDWRRNRAHYDVVVMRNLNNTVQNKSQ